MLDSHKCSHCAQFAGGQSAPPTGGTIMRHWIAAGLAALGLMGAMATDAAAKSLDDILSDGTIRIGINPNFPNMSTRNDAGEWQGFDIEIGQMIADKLGVEVEWVPTETAQRVPFLVSDRIDLSLGALTRNSERAKLIDYTVPLHTEVLAVLATDQIEGETWEDFNREGVTLANMRGNWTVGWIEENMPNVELELVDSIADTVRLVAQGRADAIVENIDFFMGFTEQHEGVTWRVVPEPIFVAYCAIGVAQGNDNLTEVLNIVLYDLHSSGAVNETWEKNYGAPMLRPVEPSPWF
ncbi:transporter substrate-binding domain-containing protein [Rhodobacteraceae bacterium CCMM004]|nr:transporter substrate-binding domain-containing protein [Rhodobacteraceae bacterium CCMM004]